MQRCSRHAGGVGIYKDSSKSTNVTLAFNPYQMIQAPYHDNTAYPIEVN